MATYITKHYLTNRDGKELRNCILMLKELDTDKNDKETIKQVLNIISKRLENILNVRWEENNGKIN